MLNLIALAIPVFFACIGVELWAARRQGRAVYRFGDAVSDLSAGILQQVLLIFHKALLLAAYTWVYEHRLLSLTGAASWVAAFVLVDLVYYWWHRLSHEVNFLWAAHVVHHSSEDYNLAVALRQGIVTALTTLPFHLPLALLGVPPLQMAVADSLNTLYQFWIHTELVGKLGWYERLFNTPSHHRVHHAINPRYLDKNYGGILILWDRLFGSFALETEAPVYGLVKGLKSYSPIWAQLHYWSDLAQLSAKARHPVDKLLIWLKPPPWLPRDMTPYPPAPEVAPESYRKYDPVAPPVVQRYVFAQLVVAVPVVTTMLFFETQAPMPVLAVGAALVAAATAAWGGLLEGRSWAVPFELARLALAAVAGLAGAVLYLHGPAQLAAGAGALAYAAGMGGWLLARRRSLVVAPAT